MVSAGLGAEDERYHAQAEAEGFVLANPDQGLRASLGRSGIEVNGPNGSVEMNLVGWGCESALTRARGGQATAEANRVAFAWEGITEWYVSGTLGVEQGFTVAGPAAGCESAGELVIELDVKSPAVLAGDGRSLDFPEAGLRYSGLVSVDASGRELSARLDLDGKRLAIRTEIADADWPVTVDPTFEVAKLLASDGAALDRFGTSVAVSGNTIVIGAYQDDDNGFNSGSAYVFTEPVGGWTGTLTEGAKLLASDGAEGDHLGISVAISGSVVVVGARQDNDNGTWSGSAYVFVEPGGGWSGTLTEAAKLVASDGIVGDLFGEDVAISGSTIVAGAGHPTTAVDLDGLDKGSAYVFTEPVGGWAGTLNESAKLLASDGAAGDFFGGSVAVSGSTIFVGTPADDDACPTNPLCQSGSVYIFTEPVGGWTGTLTEGAKLLASDGDVGDRLGVSVAVSGSTVVAGAFADGDACPADPLCQSGSAYVFIEPVSGWTGTFTENAKLLASDDEALDFFGDSVDISGSTVVVGAWRDDDNGSSSGSAYVFTEPVGGWTGTLTENDKLLASDGAVDDFFGDPVAVSGGTVVVGALSDDDNGFDSGSAYVYSVCDALNGDNLTLMDDTVLDTQSYHVCDTITVGPNYVVSGPSGDLTLGAGNAVIFLDDFTVTVDGTLTVLND